MTLTLHPSTFEYLKPTAEQQAKMDRVRAMFASFANTLDQQLPPGPDKTYILRHLREAAMWSNVALTRTADGAPRK